MGKNIKSYATIPSPFPREREGSLTAKVLKILRFKYGTAEPYTLFAFKNLRLNRTHYTKFFNFSKTSHKVIIPANYADSTQFAHTVCELRETRTFC